MVLQMLKSFFARFRDTEQPRAYLCLLAEGTIYDLGSKPSLIGRVAGDDTQHFDYIVVASETVGRQHAVVEYQDRAWYVTDQSSLNGTFVNDEIVQKRVLKNGDRIRLHDVEFEFLLSSPKQAVPADDREELLDQKESEVQAQSGSPSTTAGSSSTVTRTAAKNGVTVDFDLSGAQDDDSRAERRSMNFEDTTMALTDLADANVQEISKPPQKDDKGASELTSLFGEGLDVDQDLAAGDPQSASDTDPPPTSSEK